MQEKFKKLINEISSLSLEHLRIVQKAVINNIKKKSDSQWEKYRNIIQFKVPFFCKNDLFSGKLTSCTYKKKEHQEKELNLVEKDLFLVLNQMTKLKFTLGGDYIYLMILADKGKIKYVYVGKASGRKDNSFLGTGTPWNLNQSSSHFSAIRKYIKKGTYFEISANEYLFKFLKDKDVFVLVLE